MRLVASQISLNGDWRVRKRGGRDELPARVPGCIHTDLLAQGRIPDPFFRDNEATLQWIGESDWIYTRDVDVPASLLKRERVVLRCEGLDTLASVRLNGQLLGRTSNMYRVWEFDVRPLLKPGRNRIEVAFDSVLPVMARREAERPLPGWFGPRESRGRAYIRKEPCNFGWDWGPILVTCGIWKDIALVAFDKARLTGVHIRQAHHRSGVSLTVAPQVERLGRQTLQARLTVRQGEACVSRSDLLPLGAGTLLEARIANPKLWWPNGMGAQPLYTVEVELFDATGALLGSVTRKIGLRTLRLDRHADTWGESFQFVVNGLPFFAKGGNWIPADAFITRVRPQDYRRLLDDVVAANMNMLRVWGGGVYESDLFYDLCDERGICVWQDFMFAGSTFPAFDKAYLANFKVEAQENIRRLRHHACIALWCGNNEIEMGMAGDTWTDKTMSWKDYAVLFDTLLPAVVRQEDPDRDYWPCSPHSPHGDRNDHANPKWGDAHLWAVWHGRQPFEWYRTCEHRFNSEFGFQSFPEPRTVEAYTEPADRNITTRVMEFHQRSGIGNTVIMQYLLEWYRLPTSFESTLWLSQILQAMAMKYAVEHWRRSMPRGMGTLYWQINDCWPVASWSSIDYHGRWKALHYLARRFYEPVLVSGLEESQSGSVAIHVTNDLRVPVSGTVTWLVTDVDGRPLRRGSKRVVARELGNTPVTVVDVSRILGSEGAHGVLVWLDFRGAGGVRSDNLVLFAKPKHLELRAPRLKCRVRDLKNGSFAVTMESAAPALWTWLELGRHDARYSDNFVNLRPGRKQVIVVTPARRMTLAEVRRKLKVSSLVDTYA